MPTDLQPAAPAALLCALTFDGEETAARARAALVALFGPLRASSAPYAFDYTDYYEREMGGGLHKQLLCFGALVDPSTLASAKRRTMRLERELGRQVGGQIRRRANVDPGLLSMESLVLATTKYAGHRICIAPQLYAETTLLYQKGRYRPLPWTYPDYRSELVREFLQEMRRWLIQVRR